MQAGASGTHGGTRTSEPIDHAGYPADDCEASAPGVPRYRPAPTQKGPHAHPRHIGSGRQARTGSIGHFLWQIGSPTRRTPERWWSGRCYPLCRITWSRVAFRGRSWGSVIGMLRVRLQPGPRFDRCYAISPEDGQLTPISSFSTPGRTARDFGIDETGPRLYAGNQQSDAIVQCDIDLGTVPEAGDVEW